MLLDSAGLAASIAGFGLVYGVAAQAAGMSSLDVGVMSLIVFAGGSQFAVLAYIATGAPWLVIVLVTALINSRHLLYSAALSPLVADLPTRVRAAMGYPLSDETFALAISHFRRIGYADVPGYFLVGLGATVLPWVAASVVGTALAGNIAEPALFGLDVVFPAAMAGLAVGLISDRRDVIAAVSAFVIGITVALVTEPALGIVCGGVFGPLIGLLFPVAARPTEPEMSAP